MVSKPDGLDQIKQDSECLSAEAKPNLSKLKNY